MMNLLKYRLKTLIQGNKDEIEIIPEFQPRGIKRDPAQLPDPIMVLARGHSGTTLLAKVLEAAGVYVGNSKDPASLNKKYDSMLWTYKFQRALVPLTFQYGKGVELEGHKETVQQVGEECLRFHLADYEQGQWGFKTCASMFAYPLYDFMFPNAKYVYMVRDGRDVILSSIPGFHLTNSRDRNRYWDYFKIITYGISNDIDETPFPFPEKPERDDEVMKHAYWVQAKSWREHVRMMEHLKANNQLSSQIYTIKYEDACQNPIETFSDLFDFLELDLTDDVKTYIQEHVFASSVGRWKDYKKQLRWPYAYKEDLPAIFESMKPELELLGYT